MNHGQGASTQNGPLEDVEADHPELAMKCAAQAALEIPLGTSLEFTQIHFRARQLIHLEAARTHSHRMGRQQFVTVNVV
jgi:hypothetical protein